MNTRVTNIFNRTFGGFFLLYIMYIAPRSTRFVGFCHLYICINFLKTPVQLGLCWGGKKKKGKRKRLLIGSGANGCHGNGDAAK